MTTTIDSISENTQCPLYKAVFCCYTGPKALILCRAPYYFFQKYRGPFLLYFVIFKILKNIITSNYIYYRISNFRTPFECTISQPIQRAACVPNSNC